MERYVYMDNNATTPIHPEVKAEMRRALDVFGNPSSLHSYGRRARRLVEKARNDVASFIGANSDELIFVGSGSEANNTVLSTIACCANHCGLLSDSGMEMVITGIEHPCVLVTAKCLMAKGTRVKYLEVDKYGKIDIKKLNEAISDKTWLVSVMMANNEVGTIQDIKSIAEVVHKKGVLFHTDAVQAVGKVPVNVRELGVDFLTLSAHKIYGPKGIGAYRFW